MKEVGEIELQTNNYGIVVVGYNKTKSILRLLKTLQNADYGTDRVDLIISIDNSGSKDVEDIARDFEWKYGDKEIRTFEERQGLRKHILSCGEFLKKYEAIFVLEDDLIVAPNFYNYGKRCIEVYKYEDNVEGISLYSTKWNQNANFPFEPYKTEYDVYFMQLAQSWGQIWFKDRYEKFMEWYEKNVDFFENEEDTRIPHNLYTWGNNSWLKYHIAYCIVMNKYFVYPYYSYTSAFVENGTHFGTDLTRFHSDMANENVQNYTLPDFNDKTVVYDAFNENEMLKKYMESQWKTIVEIDLYGTKKILNREGYVLSTQILPYKIIKEYALQLRPMELNVYMDIEGEGIYLYNVEEKGDNSITKKHKRVVKIWDYFMRERFLMWNEMIPLCLQKIENLIHIMKKGVNKDV